MNGTKSKIMFIMCMALGLMSIGYAFFATNLSITSTGNITAGWNVKFVSITEGNNGGTGGSNASTPTFTDTTATISANLRVPGDYMEYEVVLQNAGGIDAIIEKINVEETGSPAIIFSVTGINEGETLASGLSKTMKIRVEYDKDVTSQPSDTVKVLKISVKAVQDAGGMTFPEENEKEPDSYDGIQYLKNKILSDNTAQADTNIDFSQPSSDTNGKGLYYTNQKTEGNKTTYYFRGAVENNYVKFGTYNKHSCTYNGVEVSSYEDYFISGYDGSYTLTQKNIYLTENLCTAAPVCQYGEGENVTYNVFVDIEYCEMTGGTFTREYATYTPIETELLWKIVRINEDGSIRLISSEVVGDSMFNDEPYEIVCDDNGCGNEQSTDNAYVGYMYGTAGSNTYTPTHTNTNNSTMKDYLDNWYLNNSNLNNYSNLISQDAGFCNDRSVASSAGTWIASDTALGYGKNTTFYGANNRSRTSNPQYACPNAENDLFTTKDSSKGNKVLTYPVGLITGDEVIYAGSAISKSNTSMYLVDSKGPSFTMSPSYAGSNSTMMVLYTDGTLPAMSLSGILNVRPVINLKSTVELSLELSDGCTKQDGTAACPYIIKTN